MPFWHRESPKFVVIVPFRTRSCIYGKCRKTDDPALLNYDRQLPNTRGGRFFSIEDAGCNDESVDSLAGCLMVKIMRQPRADKHPSLEDDFPSQSMLQRMAEMRERYGVRADRRAGPPPVINKLFKFPKIFGIQIQMDKLLESHFGSREAAEAVYIKAMGDVNNAYRKTLGFTFRIQSFCWMSSSLLGATTRDQQNFDLNPFRKEQDYNFEEFSAFTTDNVNNTNIVMFTRYVSHEEWEKYPIYGWTFQGSIWHSKLKLNNRKQQAPYPAIIHVMHIENRSMENITVTIAHELAHVFGATHTHQLPYSLEPQFKDNCDSGGNGTILSYCPNRELRFLPGTVNYIHEYMNQMDRYRFDELFVHVFGKRETRQVMGDLDNSPLMGHVHEIKDNPCHQVTQLFQKQAMHQEEEKEQVVEEHITKEQEEEEHVVEEEVKDEEMRSRDTISTDVCMGIIIALAVAVVTVVLVSVYKLRGDGSVSINRSSLKDLTKLKYIGDVKASWIITERENAKRGGTFKDFEDLINRVDGITKRLVQVWMKGNVVVTID